jgi:tonB-linked outer membrane protein, susC/ragA family
MQNHCIIQFFGGLKSSGRALKKIPLAMKLLFMILICSVGLAYASEGYAQKTSISLKVINCTVEEVLDKIQKESGFGFFINNRNIDLTRRVSVSASEKNILHVLEQIFSGTNVEYKIIDDKIVLTSNEMKVAQQKGNKVSGTVKDQHGELLVGVSIMEKGTGNGTITDMDGNYQITTHGTDPVLVFSYIGYQTLEVSAKGKNSLNIILQDDAKKLDEVVVTALGIKREQKALSYNVQKVGNEDLTAAKSSNFMSSLSGKVAGVNINMSSAGAGGASRVVMRGTKSLGDDNNALYVVDGVPLFNVNNGDLKNGSLSLQPRGEGISDFNPDDIESISVLSGPAAAALYGSEAASGVIMITTKKGEEGKVKVTYTNNTTFSEPIQLLKFQNSYGNRNGEFMSWGEKGTGTNFDPTEFFRTGANIQNTVSMSTGTDKNQTYLSIASTNTNGIMPTNKYERYNFTFRNSTKFLKDKMTLDVGASYIIQKDENMMAQGRYYNPLISLYLYPRGEDFSDVQVYEEYNEARGVSLQRWKWGTQGMDMQNPYWIAHRNNYGTKKDRYMMNASLSYDILDWLNVAGRVRIDHAISDYERKNYAGTNTLFAGEKGFYSLQKINDKQAYADFMVNINKRFGEDFSLSANIGTSYADKYNDVAGAQGALKDMSNFFTYHNIDIKNGRDSYLIQSGWRQRTYSVFANVELGWKSMLYLTATGRNDWDSALANTEQPCFFYPSVGLSAVISEMAKLPEFISYLKVRGSYASVGSPITRGLSQPGYTYTMGSGAWATKTFRPLGKLYPERTKSYEIGLSSKLFHNTFSIDLTLYKSNTYNQTLSIPLSASSGFSSMYAQSGNIENRGLELTVGYNNKWGDFGWNSVFTYSANRNKIKELLDDYYDPLTNEHYSINYINKGNIRLVPGGTMGDIYADKILARDDNGRVEVDNTGKVKLQSIAENPLKLGSILPKGNLGFKNNFSYKGFDLGFLITARLGGIVVSQTQSFMDYYGVSETTAKVRDNGGVAVNQGIMDAEKFYSVVSGENGLISRYVYSATNVRLQELTFGYTFPRKWTHDVGLSLGLTASNLWMIYCKAPFDPELTSSTGTYGLGTDYFMQPSTRNIGFNVKLSF